MTAALIIASLLLSYQALVPGAPMSGIVEDGEAYIPIDAKPAHDIVISGYVKALRHGWYSVSLLTESHAYINGTSFILGDGEVKHISFKYYFTDNASKLLIRVAADGKLEYSFKASEAPRFDAGLKGDAPNSCEEAPVIGSLSGNGSSLGFEGFLTGMYDLKRGLDQSDCYKVHVKTSGEAVLTAVAYPVEGAPRLELVAIWGGIAIDSDEADTNEGSAMVKVKYAEVVEGDLCLRVSSAHAGSYAVNLTLIDYGEPEPGPELPPVSPPPGFWALIALLILLFFWLLGIRPPEKLKPLADKVDALYLKLEAAARKVMRCEEPAPVKPAATRSLAKFLTGAFLISSGSIAAWIAALGLLPAALLMSLEGWIRAFTYWMLHANVEHLIGNFAFLLTLAPWLEHKFGKGKLLFYMIIPFNLGAVLAHLLWSYMFGQLMVYAIGASGIISGIAGAFYVLYPEKHFIILGKRVNAETYLATWFALNLLYAFLDAGGGVAYFAHVGGFLSGLGVGAYERRAA